MERVEIDWREPQAAFAPFAGEPYAVLLQGGAQAVDAPWAFIVAEPAMRIEARTDAREDTPAATCGPVRCLVDGRPAPDGPFETLRAVLRRRSRPRSTETDAGDAPFQSGLLGFAGYELGGLVEPSAAGPASPYALPDMAFGVYDAVAAFHRPSARAVVYGRTARAVETLAERLGDAPAVEAPAPPSFRIACGGLERDAYARAVADVVERIRAGDFYQANISRRLVFETDAPARAFDVFRRLQNESASAFAGLLQYDDGDIISNSPERFFRIRCEEAARRIVADPIKGTRARGLSPQQDEELAAELLADPKERAENVMIADLMRNDLSRVCADHTVREDFICRLFSYAHVHHLVSRISGVLRDDVSAVEALRILFPCGSITGAPKPEAMKTIGEIEGEGRGPYCGAIGYFDDRGGAEFAVAIRVAILDAARRRLSAPVGGGVTLRSDPAREYEETRAKAAAWRRVVIDGGSAGGAPIGYALLGGAARLAEGAS